MIDFRGSLLPALVALGCFLLPASPASAQFLGAEDLRAPAGAWGLATGDFDRDGRADLVVSGPGGRAIQTFRGRAGGVFLSPLITGVDGLPRGLVVADFDGDGIHEILGADESGGGLLRLDASGQTPLGYSTGRQFGDEEALDLVSVDLDGDLDEDIIVAVPGADQLQVWINESGTFARGLTIEAGDQPTSIHLLDGDRLLVGLTGRMEPRWDLMQLPGFEVLQRLPADAPAWARGVDLDGDAFMDLALLDGAGRFELYGGQADGSYSWRSDFPVQSGGGVFELEGMAGPGQRFLVQERARHRIVRYDQNGNEEGSWYTGAAVARLLRGDLVGEGSDELYVPLPEEDRVLRLRVQGDGYDAHSASPAGQTPLRLSWLEDAPKRAVTLSPLPGLLTVLRPEGDRLVQESEFSVPLGSDRFAAGDVDGDGLRDYMIASRNGGIVLLRGSNPSVVESILPPGVDVRALGITEFSGDAHPDLLIADAREPGILLMAGNGTGQFSLVDTLSASNQVPVELQLRDFDLDGRKDLAVLGEGALLQLRYNLPGSGYPASNFAVGNRPRGLGFGKINGDDFPDIVVGNTGDSSYTVLLSAVARVYAVTVENEPTPAGCEEVVVEDVDQDGLADLIFGSADESSLALHFGLGSSNFSIPLRPRGVAVLADLAAVDLDGDGIRDLLALDPLGSVVVTMLAWPQATPPPSFRAERSPRGIRLLVESEDVSRSAWVAVRDDGREVRLEPSAEGRWEAVDQRAGAGSLSYSLRGEDLHDSVEAAPAETEWQIEVEHLAGGSVVLRVNGQVSGPPLLRLFDLRGREVARPSAGYGGGRWTANWNGRDGRGGRLAAGRYQLLVEADGSQRLRPLWLR